VKLLTFIWLCLCSVFFGFITNEWFVYILPGFVISGFYLMEWIDTNDNNSPKIRNTNKR